MLSGMAARRVHGEIDGDRGTLRDRVLEIVRSIPAGRVMTYGQISTLLASRISPLAVGWMLHRCPEDVPWHRVVNAAGGFSTDRLPDMPPGLQQALLEGEGTVLGPDGRVDLEAARWWPRAVPPPAWEDE